MQVGSYTLVISFKLGKLYHTNNFYMRSKFYTLHKKALIPPRNSISYKVITNVAR